jgi:Zn-dependent M28 family amino/carboxypeptidase
MHPFRLRKGEEPIYYNVEARFPGVNSNRVVIVAAHLDCTASRDPSYRPRIDPTPGADDDASGIAGVLAAARAIKALSRTAAAPTPRAEFRFILFNAEEQAQRGSRVYAKREKLLGTRIDAVYQMDMIGYRCDGNRAFELHAGFKKNRHVQAKSLDVAHHLVEVCAAAEIPLTPQVYFHRPRKPDPGQGFSDHTSFHKHRYPAILVSENFFPGQGSVVSPACPNPDYHLPEDTADNLDFGYAANIARAVTAAAWHRATRMERRPRGQAHDQQQNAEDGNEPGGNKADAGHNGHHRHEPAIT